MTGIIKQALNGLVDVKLTDHHLINDLYNTKTNRLNDSTFETKKEFLSDRLKFYKS